jgi:hypothetical protein
LLSSLKDVLDVFEDVDVDAEETEIPDGLIPSGVLSFGSLILIRFVALGKRHS